MQFLTVLVSFGILACAPLAGWAGLTAGRRITDTRISGSMVVVSFIVCLTAIVPVFYYDTVYELSKRLILFLPLIPLGFGLGVYFGRMETHSERLLLWYSWRLPAEFEGLSIKEKKRICDKVPLAVMEVADELGHLTSSASAVQIQLLRHTGGIKVSSNDHQVLRNLPRRLTSKDLYVFEHTGLIDGQAPN